MAPGILSEDLSLRDNASAKNGSRVYPAPLKQSGALDAFQFEDITPVIGREFLDVNIVDDLLNAPNADQLIRDVAITSTKHNYILLKAPSTDSTSF